MITWQEFEKSSPEMARFGVQRMSERVMYVGTIRKDGYPRVHPFTPFISSGHLFAFMEPTSPKGRDIRRDGRYVIHSLVKDMQGSDGEFCVTGRARLVTEPKMRALATEGCPYRPAERYILFEFLVEESFTVHYADGEPQYVRWKESGSKS